MDGNLEIQQIDNTAQAVSSLANAGLAYLMGNKTAAVACAIEGALVGKVMSVWLRDVHRSCVLGMGMSVWLIDVHTS